MKGYKTVILNTAVAALPVVDYALNHGDLIAGFLGPKGAAALSILGLVNVLLRWTTTSPIFKAE